MMMASETPSAGALRVADLPNNRITTFDVPVESAQMRAIADELGFIGLRKLRFSGKISAFGKSDWQLDATLGATVIQECTITLEPVTTRIDAPVKRLFVKAFDTMSEEEEVEMPEDDTSEPLGTWIDPEAIMIEALSLESPDYPRVPGAELGELIVTEPGQTPMTDEAARPFAGLAALKAQLKEDPSEEK